MNESRELVGGGGGWEVPLVCLKYASFFLRKESTSCSIVLAAEQVVLFSSRREGIPLVYGDVDCRWESISY